jgi:hypothetical protein
MKRTFLHGIAHAAGAIVALSTVSPAHADVELRIGDWFANIGLVDIATGAVTDVN